MKSFSAIKIFDALSWDTGIVCYGTFNSFNIDLDVIIAVAESKRCINSECVVEVAFDFCFHDLTTITPILPTKI